MQAHAELRGGLSFGFEHARYIFFLYAQRLFAKHIYAELKRPHDHVRVQIMRRADVHGVGFFGREHLLVVGVDGGSRPFAPFGKDVAHGDYIRAEFFEDGEMHLAYHPETNESNFHIFPPGAAAPLPQAFASRTYSGSAKLRATDFSFMNIMSRPIPAKSSIPAASTNAISAYAPAAFISLPPPNSSHMNSGR